MNPEFSLLLRCQYSAEAHIYRTKLADAGIEVFMRDHITIDSDPLVSNAIGGVKIMVRTVDLGRAQAVLQDIEPYSVDDQGSPVECGQCGAKEVQMMTSITGAKSILGMIVAFLVGLFPVFTHRYRCDACGYTFKA